MPAAGRTLCARAQADDSTIVISIRGEALAPWRFDLVLFANSRDSLFRQPNLMGVKAVGAAAETPDRVMHIRDHACANQTGFEMPAKSFVHSLPRAGPFSSHPGLPARGMPTACAGRSDGPFQMAVIACGGSKTDADLIACPDQGVLAPGRTIRYVAQNQ